MMIIKDNDTAYIAIPTSSFLVSGYLDSEWEKLADNFPVWKVPNDDNIIVGVEGGGLEADIFMYDPDFVRGELTMEKLVLEVVPKIQKRLNRYGKIDKDGSMNCYFYFAQNGKMFGVTRAYDCDEIESYHANGSGSRMALSALSMTEGLPPEERLRFTTRLLEKGSKSNLFPLVVIDTKTCVPYLLDK